MASCGGTPAAGKQCPLQQTFDQRHRVMIVISGGLIGPDQRDGRPSRSSMTRTNATS